MSSNIGCEDKKKEKKKKKKRGEDDTFIMQWLRRNLLLRRVSLIDSSAIDIDGEWTDCNRPALSMGKEKKTKERVIIPAGNYFQQTRSTRSFELLLQ